MYRSLLGVALSALFLVAQPAFADAPIVIKFSHVVADDTPKGRGALLFKKLVEERLAGEVKVEVFANSTLFGDADELQALKDGKVQMLAPSLSKFEGYTRQLEVFDLPFLFDDLEAVKRFQKRSMSRELLHSMARSGIYGLAYWNNGMKQLSANRELRAPADVKGLSFRIQPSSVIDAQFGLLGAKAVKLPFAETLQALQDGRVQGTENTWSNIASQKLDGAQPFVTETNHGVLSYMLISNQKFWNSLPYPVRIQLETIIDEVTAEVNKDAEALNQKAREQVAGNGKARIVGLTPAEREAWRTAMQPLWKQFEGEIGGDVLRAAQVVNRKH